MAIFLRGLVPVTWAPGVCLLFGSKKIICSNQAMNTTLKRSDAFVYFHFFLSIFVLYSMFSSFPFRNLKLCIFSLFKFVSNINKERTRNRVKHNTNVNVNFDVIYLSID